MQSIRYHTVLIYDILIFRKERHYANTIQYKIDVLSELKKKGFSTYRLRKEKILGEATIQKIRQEELVSWDNMATLCRLLGCQPGDIVKYSNDKAL